VRIPRHNPCSPKTQKFLADLFDALMMTRAQRNAWLTIEFHREIKFLDQLSPVEGSHAIDRLKEMKESLR